MAIQQITHSYRPSFDCSWNRWFAVELSSPSQLRPTAASAGPLLPAWHCNPRSPSSVHPLHNSAATTWNYHKCVNFFSVRTSVHACRHAIHPTPGLLLLYVLIYLMSTMLKTSRNTLTPLLICPHSSLCATNSTIRNNSNGAVTTKISIIHQCFLLLTYCTVHFQDSKSQARLYMDISSESLTIYQINSL